MICCGYPRSSPSCSRVLQQQKGTTPMANRQYKDSLFRAVFKEPAELCHLYSAIVPETRMAPKDIQLYTLDSVLMDRLKNDISFQWLGRHIILLEHQSTWNPNLPLRCFWYAGDLYRHIVKHKEAMYGTAMIRIPSPQFYVLYIGDPAKPLRSSMRLSDAFMEPSNCMELKATVINITYSAQNPVLDRCRTLHDYSLFIHHVRTRCEEGNTSLDDAIRESAKYCAEHDILSGFIRAHYEEVCNMVNLWYNEKEAHEYWREEGLAEGISQGEDMATIQSLKSIMEKMKVTVEEAMNLCGIPEEKRNRYANLV